MTTAKRTRDPEAHREHLRRFANRERDIADETAAKFGCDDPLHPFMPVGDEQEFRDWLDFVERVAIPLVEADGDEAKVQEAMRLYRKASPHFICVSLMLAARSEPQHFAASDPENGSVG